MFQVLHQLDTTGVHLHVARHLPHPPQLQDLQGDQVFKIAFKKYFHPKMEFFVFLNILDISEVSSMFKRIFVMKCNSKYEKDPFNYLLTKCSMLPSSKEVLLKKIALRD